MTTNEPLLTNPEGIERWLEVPFPPSPDACRAAFHDARLAHVLKAAHEATLVALESRAANVSPNEANELHDILRTLVPTGVAFITSARELVKSWEERGRAMEAAEKRAAEFLSDLESVNQIARDYGYGQGEIDGDLAGCIRAIIDRATKATQEGRNEL